MYGGVEVKIKHGARDVLNSDKAVVSIIKVELVEFFLGFFRLLYCGFFN